MPDPAERFIAAAVRPMDGNAEMQMVAGQELRELIQASTKENPPLEHASIHLEKNSPISRWRLLMHIAAAIASLAAIIPLAREIHRYRIACVELFAISDPDIFHVPSISYDPSLNPKSAEIFPGLTPPQLTLLFGTIAGRYRGFEPLWESEPGNAAFFADHAVDRSHESTLPADYLQISDRLDPGNSWFRYQAAKVISLSAIQTVSFGKSHPHVAPTCEITDPAKFAECLALFEEASRQQKYHSYEKEQLLKRLNILPPGEDVLERKFSREYLEMGTPRSFVGDRLRYVLEVRMKELAASGDSQGFIALVDNWELFIRRRLAEEDVTPEEVIEAGFLQSVLSRAGLDAATTLKLDPLRERFAVMMRAQDDHWKTRRARQMELDAQFSGGSRAAHDMTRFAHMVENPPSVSKEELRTGRMAESALLDRLLTAGVWALMVIAAILAALTRFWHGLKARRLSASLGRVLGPCDFLLIFTGGVLAPFVIEHLVFAAKGPASVGMASSEIRFSALAAAMLALPCVIAGNRVKRCLGFLAPGKKIRILNGLCMLGLACWFCSWPGLPDAIAHGATLCASALLLATFFTGCVWVLFSSRSRVLLPLICGRAVVPAYSFAVLLAALTIPYDHAREKRWTDLDTFTKIRPGIPAPTAYEGEIARLRRVEILKQMDAKL